MLSIRSPSGKGKCRLIPPDWRQQAGAALLQRHTEKLRPVALQPVAAPPRDLFLRRPDLGIGEFDDLSKGEVDQVAVLRALGILVAGAAILLKAPTPPRIGPGDSGGATAGRCVSSIKTQYIVAKTGSGQELFRPARPASGTKRVTQRRLFG
jgi:hypothetical protein